MTTKAEPLVVCEKAGECEDCKSPHSLEPHKQNLGCEIGCYGTMMPKFGLAAMYPPIYHCIPVDHKEDGR